ncbi:SAM-dependent methyltransferase [Actinocrinis puniceicyclus]|uniref:SAM-dependent methyltransferase n=1 Tax=Actinocrinis puniceicyclus TaxID=977794 RepID=A0A8J8BC74_9ACTN|nr:SAM-dependent methyltransferase [Actinocrinis puniceicyclus]MBS2961479.1 SAM-dependent methyltransferase [Actinocrinis puniceicyclus]
MSTADFDRAAHLLGEGVPPSRIHTDQPSPARIYDYWLGGKNYYPVDRDVAETILAMAPTTRAGIKENRAFLLRAVERLARQGIDQFLDIGCGLPFSPNVHEVAQSVAPNARVTYVDSDPIVRAHAQALMQSGDPEHIAVLHADARRPQEILEAPDTRRVLDFDRPVGVLLVAVLHFIQSHDDPRQIVRTLMNAFPAGSCLVISHGTADFNPAGVLEATGSYHATSSYVPRTGAEIEELFLGMPLVEPGLVPVAQWPDMTVPSRAEQFGLYAGVARKPE